MNPSSALIVVVLLPAVTARYNEQLAVQYARLSGAAYCWTQDVENWSCGHKCSANVTNVNVCQGSTTKSFVARWDGKCLLTFQGTGNPKAMIKDLEFLKSATSWDSCDGCKVHGGFLREWQSMQDCITSRLEAIGCGKSEGLHVTGHSLGAALAGVSMMSLHNSGWEIAEGYNFGMPRTGNQAFAQRFDALFGDRFYRITHHKDPVPQVPPSELVVNWYYEHPTPEVFYDGDVGEGYLECDDVESSNCAGRYSNIAVDLLHLPDHLDYMGEQTSLLGCNIWEENVVV